MGENMSRILIRTLLHQWIQSIPDSPNREIRKMVDLSAFFAKGAFHQLIQTTRQILKKETSAYYALVHNLIQNTAEARLITYGMNLGYNCGICGAGRIRELKQSEEVHIPWSIALELPGDDFGQNERRYQELISQGEELGIYCWFLLPEQEPNKMLSLVQMHPDSAFTVICPPGSNIGALVDAAQCCNNLMVAVRYDSLASTASDMLKDAGFLYSLYYPYNADTLDQIESGHLLEQIEAFSPAFCMFIP